VANLVGRRTDSCVDNLVEENWGRMGIPGPGEEALCVRGNKSRYRIQ